jgi:hypothetical protein
LAALVVIVVVIALLCVTGRGNKYKYEKRNSIDSLQLADGGIVSYDGRPTQSQLDRKDVLIGQLRTAEGKFEELTTSSELASLNSQLQGRGLEPLSVMSREDWEKSQETSGSSSSVVGAKRLAGIMASRALLPLGF